MEKMHNSTVEKAKAWLLKKKSVKKDYACPEYLQPKKEIMHNVLSVIEEMADSDQIAKDYALGIYTCINPAYLPRLSEINEAGATTAEEIKGWSEILTTNKLIAARIRPPWFSFKAKCQRCGEVPLDWEPKEVLVGCPWCHSS